MFANTLGIIGIILSLNLIGVAALFGYLNAAWVHGNLWWLGPSLGLSLLFMLPAIMQAARTDQRLKKGRTYQGIAIVLLVLVGATGCGTIGAKTVLHTLAGCVIGGGAGAAVGTVHGNPVAGAVYGGLAGCALGAASGNAADAEEARVKSQEDRIRTELLAQKKRAEEEAKGVTECRTKLSQRASNGAVVQDEIAKECETYSRRLGDLGNRLDVAPPPPVKYEPSVVKRTVPHIK